MDFQTSGHKIKKLICPSYCEQCASRKIFHILNSNFTHTHIYTSQKQCASRRVPPEWGDERVWVIFVQYVYIYIYKYITDACDRYGQSDFIQRSVYGYLLRGTDRWRRKTLACKIVFQTVDMVLVHGLSCYNIITFFNIFVGWSVIVILTLRLYIWTFKLGWEVLIFLMSLRICPHMNIIILIKERKVLRSLIM